MVTATWQLARLPSAPQYWCDTPTEWRPRLGMPVSSNTNTPSGEAKCPAKRAR